MRIIVTVRTRNEEQNIERFCRAYWWADKILVADGGSEDNTVSLAQQFSNVEVRDFLKKADMKNGYWRNPSGEHINFLVDWAQEENPDWILFDDCDCVPNFLLQRDTREVLEESEYDMLFAVRIYLYKEEGYFPKLSLRHNEPGVWATSMWGWRKDVNIRFKVVDGRGQEFSPKRGFNSRMNLCPPYALLHRPWLDDEMIDKKMTFYKESGQIEGITHPLNIGGRLEELPDWADETTDNIHT